MVQHNMVCQDKIGQIAETESISAGLDYPGVSPLHCFLKDCWGEHLMFHKPMKMLLMHIS